MEQEIIKSSKQNFTVDKYDRQIRLWGARGQRRLGQARVALIQCTGAGIEALKNLTLPGVGFIEIWDNTKVEVKDLCESFFYEQGDVGNSKAQAACRNLLEMNPDVRGGYQLKNFQDFIRDTKAVQSYNLIIFGGNLTESRIRQASEVCWQLGVPCIFITVAGFFSYVRLQKKVHFVQSSNTAARKYYLRIADPFPELLDYANRHNIYEYLERASGKEGQQVQEIFREVSNIPYSLVLLHVMQKLPQNERKKAQIISQLNAIKKRVPFLFSQNIDQAIANIFDALQTPDNYMIDIGLLKNPYVQSCTKDSHLMCKFLHVLDTYLEQTGKLPQPTVLPDMNTTTEGFLSLKQIYKSKHQEDIAWICKRIGQKFGDSQVDQSAISDYINNLMNLELVEMKKYSQQLSSPDSTSLQWCLDPSQRALLLAVRLYQQLLQPGQEFAPCASDLQQHLDILLQQYNIQDYDPKYIKQLTRGRGHSNISMYSIAGALSAQEGIKLITGCFTPMRGGYLFDGANGWGLHVCL